MTVDHYRPLSAGGNDDLDNLVYACIRCNQYKHTYWPTEAESSQGFRVLHPLQDTLTQHYKLVPQTGQLEPLTVTGQFHITLLRLNRPQLVKFRLAQQLQDVFEQKLMLLEQQIHEMQATIAAQERYIAALLDQLRQ